MTGFLKLISTILWVLNYVRQNPKKSAVGATGLAGVTTAAMFYGAPGVPTNPPGLTVGGTPSDGDVVTYVDPTGPEWAAGGGGGGGDPIHTPDGTTEITRLPVYSPVSYGAAGTLNQSTLNGEETSGETSIALTAGHGTNWAVGNHLIIPKAGPAHQWAAVTPTAPTVTNGGNVTFTCSTSTDLITVASYQPWIANGAEVKVYATTSLPTVGGTPYTDGDSWFLRLGTHQNTFSVHPTALDATNNTNTVNFDGAGSGTLSMSPVGATSVSYRLVCNSGAGGRTVQSAAASTSTSVAISGLCLGAYNTLWWDAVDDGAGNYVHGYEIYGRTDDHFLTAINAVPNSRKIVFQAGGYTNFAPTDIGKSFLISSTNRGEVMAYDNGTRTLIVKINTSGESTIVNGAAVTVNGGEGAGTITGTPDFCYSWKDCGDSETEYDYRTWVWRTGVEQQRIQISGTPTGGTYVLAWGGYATSALAHNASSATVLAALNAIPGLGAITVSTSGSTPNFTHTVSFANGEYGMGNVPQIKIISSMTGGSPVYSVVTTVPGCAFNPGDLVLNPATASGVWQECRWADGERGGGTSAPSFSSTLNTSVEDMHNLRWTRLNTFYPVVAPSAAEPDAYTGEVTNKSTDTLTVTPATDSTVAAGTPVIHNETPAFKAMFDAIEAAGGGVIDIPSGDFNLYTRLNAETDDWDGVPGAGLGNKAIWNIDLPDGKVVIRGGNAVCRWRPFEIDAYYNPGGTTFDDSASQTIFNLQSISHFAMRDSHWYCCPAGEAQLEAEVGEGGAGVFSPLSNGANTATNGRQYLNNVSFVGFGGLGFFHEASVDSTRAVFIDRMLLRYGAGGHTAALGAGQSQMEISNSRIEGTNKLWKSTGLYTSDTSQSPVKLTSVDWWQIGSDGLRIRNSNAEIRGGSIVSTLDFDTISLNNQLVYAIYLENGAGHSVEGVFINTYGESITCNASDSKIVNNTIRNANISLVGSDCLASGNTIYTNDWRKVTSASSTTLTAINLTGRNSRAIGNMIRSSETVSSAAQGLGLTKGIYSSHANATDLQIIGNTVYTSDNALEGGAATVGKVSILGGSYSSYDLPGQSSTGDLQFGSGANVLIQGVTFDGLATSDEVVLNGISTANYRVKDCTFLCGFAIGSLPTGTNNAFESNLFLSSTAARLLDAGTKIVDNDFAVAPTLTGATLDLRSNRVAGVAVATPSALGTTSNDLALGVQDTHRLDPNAANTVLSSIVARAGGTTITIICVDAGAATLTLLDDDGATGTAANRIVTPDGADIVLSNNETVVLQYDATAQRWKVIGGGYTSIWNRDAQRAFEGSWVLAA